MDKWDIRFMEMAHVIATWTSCNTPGRAIGAVIVKDKRIMTTGYNGAPAGLKTCKERGECLRRKLGIASGTRAEVCYAIHAEQNAIIHAPRERMIGATLYLVGKDAVTGQYVENASACAMCKRMIINAGIEWVVIRDTKDTYRKVRVADWLENDDSLGTALGY